MRRRLVAVVGPTGSGKSALALHLARIHDGEVLSCDSVQVYRGLDVGSGKATPAERGERPHHLLDMAEPCEEMNAARWARAAAATANAVLDRGHLPIVAGGTGLYLTALLRGLFDSPPVDRDVRARLDALAARRGSARLHRVLAAVDPESAARTRAEDRVRVVRALEVAFTTRGTFSARRRSREPYWRGEALIVGLAPDRGELRDRVTERVRRMLLGGLIEETERLLALECPGGQLPRALGAIGYREVASRLREGSLPRGGDEKVLHAIVTATMQYAKRQMTYFRHQFDVRWFQTADEAEAGVASALAEEPR